MFELVLSQAESFQFGLFETFYLVFNHFPLFSRERRISHKFKKCQTQFYLLRTVGARESERERGYVCSVKKGERDESKKKS